MTRAERVRQVELLDPRGTMTGEEIATSLGISRSYARALRNDPSGRKDRARKQSYGGNCIRCGKRTDGSNGRSAEPRFCLACSLENQSMLKAPCGTPAAYSRGCRCAECKRANNERHAALRVAPVPSHGLSGYRNYGCRCPRCKKAGSVSNREYRAKRASAA